MSERRTCYVCGRASTWGCGHTKTHENEARRHRMTRKHREGRCMCFGHAACDKTSCKLAGLRTPGYMPYHQHGDVAAGRVTVRENGELNVA